MAEVTVVYSKHAAEEKGAGEEGEAIGDGAEEGCVGEHVRVRAAEAAVGGGEEEL